MLTLSSANLHTIESVFESIAFGIVALDQHGEIIFCNPAAAQMVGIELQTVSIVNWSEFYGIYLEDGSTLCPADKSPVSRALSGEAGNVLVYIQNQLGSGRSLWCNIDFKPLSSGNVEESAGAILLIQNLSEQRRLSEEAARSNLALQQFATVAAHDLQEPLRSIAGFTEMLEQYQEDHMDEKSKRCMSKIKNGVTRMQTLINDLLSYSRIQTIPQILREVDCAQVMQSCINSLNASIIEHDATITVEALPGVIADAPQLSQLFQNLVGNALKFSSEGKPPEVIVSAQRKRNFWVFSVKDNGIGIAPQYIERVFRIFQRLHPMTAYPGTGIGLAVCQTIVQRHGGKIWVESEPGNGSTFYFTIPENRGDKR